MYSGFKESSTIAQLAAIAILAYGSSPSLAAVPSADISGLPLSFEPNVGQGAPDAQFLAHGRAYAIALTELGAELSLGKARAGGAADDLYLRVQGASAARKPMPEQPLPGRVNFLIGNDPSKWHTGIATYGKVRYAEVYPGIDLVYYGIQGKLEYDFAVAPGADPRKIGLRFDGAEQVRVDPKGNLNIRAQGGKIAFLRPVAYQEIGARRVPVDASYRVSGNTLHFKMGPYDHGQRLIIDPILSYFSYLGGTGTNNIGAASPTGGPSGGNGSQAAALDAAGDLYVTGYTNATNFPLAAAFQASPPAKISGGYYAFVTKIAPDAKTLIFSTYIGGSTGYDYAYGIALDSSGDAFVVGVTGSNDFPVTAGAYQTFCDPVFPNGTESSYCSSDAGSGEVNAFVSKFSPSGTLLDSTFLGGTTTTTGAWAVAVDSAGRPYVVGSTLPGSNAPAAHAENGSTVVGFPTTAGAALAVPPYETSGGTAGVNQLTLPNTYDAFVSVFDPTLSTLLYSSLFGDSQVSTALLGFNSSSPTYGTAVTVDAAGNFYVAGWTADDLLQVTAGALQTTVGSCGVLGVGIPTLNGQCSFVEKLSPVGGANPPTVLYGTYLGNMPRIGGVDEIVSIVTDTSGDAYVSGYTNISGFPTTTGSYQPGCGTSSCGNTEFIAELNPTGTQLLAATLFGDATGNADGVNEVGPLVLDAAGNVVISGVAGQNLPQVNGLAPSAGGYTPGAGNVAPFVAKLNSTLSTLVFSTSIGDGGAGQQSVDGVAVDSSGNVYVAGNVGGGLPSSAATPGVFGPSSGGNPSGFVAKIILTAPTKTALAASPTTATSGAAVNLTATVAEVGGTSVPTGTVTFKDGTTTLGSMTLNGTGVAVYSTSTLAVGAHSITAAYGGDAANSASTSTAASVTISAPPAPTVTISAAPTSIVLGKTATLTWSSTNATACTASGSWTGSEVVSGTATVTPTAAGAPSYVLTCTGAGGSADATAALTVTTPAAPTVTIAVAPTTITVGQAATVTWSSTNATACTASGSWTGAEAVSGTATVTPTAAGASSYVLTCTGTGGSANATAALTVDAASSGHSGGGAVGLWELLGLSALSFLAYRRRVMN
jgi:Big-like domain-containing protein/beta-propeller repeat-containing protein